MSTDEWVKGVSAYYPELEACFHHACALCLASRRSGPVDLAWLKDTLAGIYRIIELFPTPLLLELWVDWEAESGYHAEPTTMGPYEQERVRKVACEFIGQISLRILMASCQRRAFDASDGFERCLSQPDRPYARRLFTILRKSFPEEGWPSLVLERESRHVHIMLERELQSILEFIARESAETTVQVAAHRPVNPLRDDRIPILKKLLDGPRRFTDLLPICGGSTSRVSRETRRLAAEGMIEKTRPRGWGLTKRGREAVASASKTRT